MEMSSKFVTGLNLQGIESFPFFCSSSSLFPVLLVPLSSPICSLLYWSIANEQFHRLNGEVKLAKDMMQQRNMGTDTGCHMCQTCPSESALHLMFLCPNSLEVWREISVRIGYWIMYTADTITDIWLNSMENAKTRGKQFKRG